MEKPKKIYNGINQLSQNITEEKFKIRKNRYNLSNKMFESRPFLTENYGFKSWRT